MRVAGVDGCPGGWVAAVVCGGSVSWRLLPDAASIVALDTDAVGVDIPIGLTDLPRDCDLLVRAELGARRSCVFPAPPREALAEPDYRTACELHRSIRGVGMSKQAFFIGARIHDMDTVMTPAQQRRIVEVHPELTFALLAGEPLPTKKRSYGRDRRRELLACVLPGVEEAMRRVPRPATDADALDALACAWTAARWLRGEAESYPPDPPCGDRGLRMRIVA